MKIISKFKDVYDMQQTMYDESHTWVRVKKEEEVFLNRALKLFSSEYYLGYVSLIFIAGDIYPCFHAVSKYKYVYESFVTFNLDKYLLFLEGMPEKGGLSLSYYQPKHRPTKLANKYFIQEKIDFVTKHLSFEDHQEALMMYTYCNDEGYTWGYQERKVDSLFIVNPCFKNLNIPILQAIDAYSLHQKLEQYIFGVLPQPDNKTIDISDKHRLESHGFDNKTSFRKGKQK